MVIKYGGLAVRVFVLSFFSVYETGVTLSCFVQWHLIGEVSFAKSIFSKTIFVSLR